MIISTLCLASILSNILAFNFTVICMAGEKPSNGSNSTGSNNYREDLDYSSVEKTVLFVSVGIGALFAVFPMTLILNKFGSRVTEVMLTLSGLLFLIPCSSSAIYVCSTITASGVGFSACLPVMGSITSHWSTLKQNGIFIAILSSFLQIAPMFTMPVAGELCTSSLGWESVYYLHGIVTIALFTVFIVYHRNAPTKHPLVKPKELMKVMFGKGSIYSGPGKQRVSKKVPYAAMYKDPAIWAILVAAFGNFMGTQLSLQFMPTYINKVLFLSIAQTGLATAVASIIMFFIKLLAGQTSDKIKQIVLVASTCILGFNSGGFFKSSQMVSRQHSHFTLANIAFVNCTCMLLTPLLSELIAPDNTPETWSIVLCLHGVILLTTNAFFCVFGSARPASWTFVSWSRKGSHVKPIQPNRQKIYDLTPDRPKIDAKL
ncbi:unnamed protein product [Toxocara canis]|uniref:MFS domain-containing protein n=1 Tax=Toxocara canis TaxID=6265 RepID=A0A183UF45_TOXCA|nr:unnamed protein product [Toxocara canis]